MENMNALDNPNPEIKKVLSPEERNVSTHQTLQHRLFDIIRDIRDPEHPNSLEELSVVDISSIHIVEPVDDSPSYGRVIITFTPTVPHCSLASIIGLSIQSKIGESNLLSPPGEHYYKLKVACAEGTHIQVKDINKQLSDKERVSAAFENPRILSLLRECTENLP